MLRKIAATALLVPLAFVPAASAEPIIEGCWGAASATYCDPSLRVTPIRGDSSPTPICAGTCTYVGVPTLEPQQDTYQVCVDYETPQGWPASECVVNVDMADIGRIVEAVQDCDWNIKDGVAPDCNG